MPMLIPDDVRAKAEIYTGDAAGQEKTRLLLAETELPLGLLPLKDIIECGYVEETGFVWLKQKKKVDHYFAKAGRYVSYAAEVSAIAEKGRLRKITGVKAKEMLIWVSLHEICVDDPPTGKLQCKAMGGLSRSFPVEAFEPDVPFPKPVTGRLKEKTDAETESTNVKAVDEKKEEEQKEAAAAEEAAPEKEKEKETSVVVAAAVDELGQKMKKMNKKAAVQPEVVAANN